MKTVVGILATFLLVQASTAFSVSEYSPRITEGEDAYPGQFPYQVSLQWGIPPLIFYRHVCGGSVLNERWVLTAGHCVTSVPKLGRTIVKVGKHHILWDDANVQVVEIARKIVHEEYPGNVAPHDIALLKLKTPLVFNERVQPVKLPAQDSVQTGDAVLSGWGSVSKRLFPRLPRFLQTATIPVLEYSSCKLAIKKLEPSAQLFETQLCTGPLDGTVSACSGDSGGPLVQYVNDQPVQIGVVSWGMYPCGSVGAPSVYTRVSSYVDWMNKKMSEN